MEIRSKDNPKAKQLAKLYASRKYRRETGLFVIEGLRGCIDAVRDCTDYGLIDVCALFYVPEALNAQKGLLPVDELLKLDDSKRFEITPEIADKISDTGTSQGVFAVARCLHKGFSKQALKSDGKYIILEGLQDPGNLGTIIRTCDAVGVDGIVLTGSCVDLYNPKTVRSAVGSMPRVDIFIENDCGAVLRAFGEKGLKTAAAVINGGTSVKSFDFSGGCAVVIGNEGRGLTKECAELCSHRVTIEMKGHIDSLNAATAAAILLWEMTR